VVTGSVLPLAGLVNVPVRALVPPCACLSTAGDTNDVLVRQHATLNARNRSDGRRTLEEQMAEAATSKFEGTEGGDPRPFQILSFDGGGLKGLFAAALLAEVEQQLHVSLAAHFDLVVGTSTGGLLALALGAGLTPAQIVDVYVDEGPRVFGSGRRLGRLWRAKHNSDGLRVALTNVFGGRLLGSSSKRLVVPAYSLDLNDVYVFKTSHHERLTRDHRELMVDVAMATTAAPTYLRAFSLRNQRLIDGGVWANNPTLIGVAEATSMLGVQLDQIRILSMGATEAVTNLGSRLENGGFAQWGIGGAAALLRAQSIGSFHAAEHLVGKHNIVRVDAKVPQGLFSLDRLDARRIRGIAEGIAGHVCPDIKQFTTHTASPFIPHNI
jgi:hypothetical protein